MTARSLLARISGYGASNFLCQRSSAAPTRTSARAAIVTAAAARTFFTLRIAARRLRRRAYAALTGCLLRGVTKTEADRVRKVCERQVGDVEMKLRTNPRQRVPERFVAGVHRCSAANAPSGLSPKPVAHAYDRGLRIVAVLMNVLTADVGDEFLKSVLLGVEDQQ